MARVRHLKLIVAVVAAMLVVGVASVALAASTIKATDNKTWSPQTKTVSKGTKVVWKNNTGRLHNVVSTSSNWSKSSSLPSGGSTSHTFKKSGTYKYRCTLHSGMTGKVVVN